MRRVFEWQHHEQTDRPAPGRAVRLPPPASVVVVSRARPAALCRCVMSLVQQDHPNFEIVVVADAAGRFALAERGLGQIVKQAAFDEANISAARNIGIGLAAGDVVAFIDDDAVAEPTWLTRLLWPFVDDRVAASTGYVLGRNGISLQWGASWIDALGRRHALDVDETDYSLHEATPGAAVKTEGTNMAFRRLLLGRMGGFDPAYRFYLDETDLNMRQAQEGQITAVVPLAQVHHGFAAGPHRRADRVPRSLYEIGASTAVFLHKFAPGGAHAGRIAAFRAEQRVRLLRHMVSGAIDPRDVGRLLETFDRGLTDGFARPLLPLAEIGVPQAPFQRIEGSGPRPGRVLAGWWWQDRGLAARAGEMAAAGAIVTVLRLSPTAAFHHVRYRSAGYWEQSGGLFGRSQRKGALVRIVRPSARRRAEIARISMTRPTDTMLG
jgi:GT2 family glycosyltransferase